MNFDNRLKSFCNFSKFSSFAANMNKFDKYNCSIFLCNKNKKKTFVGWIYFRLLWWSISINSYMNVVLNLCINKYFVLLIIFEYQLLHCYVSKNECVTRFYIWNWLKQWICCDEQICFSFSVLFIIFVFLSHILMFASGRCWLFLNNTFYTSCPILFFAMF